MNRRDRRVALAHVRATRNTWEPFERVEIPEAILDEMRSRTGRLVTCFRNNIFAVQVYLRARCLPGALQLAIRRHDGSTDIGWQDLQRIKRELGYGRFAAIEIFPDDARVVDQANMRHLFVLPSSEAPHGFTIEGEWS